MDQPQLYNPALCPSYLLELSLPSSCHTLRVLNISRFFCKAYAFFLNWQDRGHTHLKKKEVWWIQYDTRCAEAVLTEVGSLQYRDIFNLLYPLGTSLGVPKMVDSYKYFISIHNKITNSIGVLLALVPAL